MSLRLHPRLEIDAEPRSLLLLACLENGIRYASGLSDMKWGTWSRSPRREFVGINPSNEQYSQAVRSRDTKPVAPPPLNELDIADMGP